MSEKWEDLTQEIEGFVVKEEGMRYQGEIVSIVNEKTVKFLFESAVDTMGTGRKGTCSIDSGDDKEDLDTFEPEPGQILGMSGAGIKSIIRKIRVGDTVRFECGKHRKIGVEGKRRWFKPVRVLRLKMPQRDRMESSDPDSWRDAPER